MKEMYIDAVEDLMDRFDLDYDEASELAYDHMRDRLADLGDLERTRRKEQA